MGISRGKPAGFLFMMCIVVAVIGLGFLELPVHRSRYGDRVLQTLRTRIRSTFVSSTDPQLPLAFALLGTAILPNNMFAELKQVLTPVSSSDDGGGCGGGCGD